MSTLVGQRYGLRVVLHSAPSPTSDRRWRVRCDCGREDVVYGGSLRAGRADRCRDCQARIKSGNSTNHGHSRRVNGKNAPTPTYVSWFHARARCNNPRIREWKNYGGRGIRMCDRWLKFENFLADMGLRPPGTTLDRIDNDRGYEPGNCRWATWDVQAVNRRPRSGTRAGHAPPSPPPN